jgi:MFS family permease
MGLLWLMLKEEFRMHTTYSSKPMFLSFPIMTAVFAFAASVTSEEILSTTPLVEIMLVLHVSVFIYGLSVGAFGFLGRQYVERQYGHRNYIVAMPTLLPMSFRRTFLGMYLRDVVFYILLLLLPVTGGLLASIPITGFRVTSVLFLFASALVSFMLGISVSFLVSTVYIRNRYAFLAAVAGVTGVFVGYGAFRLYPLEFIFPGLQMQYALPPFSPDWSQAAASAGIGVGLIALLVVAAVATVTDRFEGKALQVSNRLPRETRRYAFAGSRSTLLAKEMLDLRRSGTVTKMFFSFVAPLLFLSFTAWYVRTGLAIPVGFNTVFYGAMVGFFGVILYNWLNNVDTMDYLDTLPVTVPQVIKTKLLAFLIMTSWVSTIFVVAIAWLNADLVLLWLALPVMFVVSVYMVVMTAYLTGLRTNTFLFDAGVLLKFSAMAMLPDVSLVILSFTIDKDLAFSATGIAVVLLSLLGATAILYRGIDEKWSRTDFGD